MKAGLLKDSIDLLESNITTSEFGENTTTWSKKYSTRANVNIQSLNRSTSNNEIVYDTTVNFKVRIYVPVTEWNRIKWKDKVYRILSVIPNHDKQEIEIITEVVNE